MTGSGTARPPYDQEDADAADAYLASVGLISFDPFAPETPEPDLILTTSLADAREMMEQAFTTRNAGGRGFRVLPLFVESAKVNAFAVDHGGLHVCGINIGLVSAVYELSLFVFSRSTIFREIGDAAGESSPALPPDAALAYWISDRVRAGDGVDGRAVGAELAPRDGQRQIAALFLTLLMLRFVWLHELFHCLNGHAGLRAQEAHGTALHEISDGAVLALVEVEPHAEASSPVSEAYCMEFDADRSAFWAMMERQAADEEPIDGVRALPAMLRLRLTAFAGVLMTFLFDQAARRCAAQAGGTHPVAYHRLHNLVRTMASNLSDPAEQMKQLLAHTLTEMDYFQDCLPQAVSGSQLLRDLSHADLQQEFDRVEDTLSATRARFSPVEFGCTFRPP